jgi:hypothetical protein
MAAEPPTPPSTGATGAPSAGALPAHHPYRSLDIVADVMTVLAWVVAILGGIGVIAGVVATIYQQGLIQALAVLIAGGIYVALIALFLFAGAALIRVAVEANNRLTSEAVRQRRTP